MPTLWSKYPYIITSSRNDSSTRTIATLDCVYQGIPLTNLREEECENGHKWSEFHQLGVLTYCSANMGEGDGSGVPTRCSANMGEGDGSGVLTHPLPVTTTPRVLTMPAPIIEMQYFVWHYVIQGVVTPIGTVVTAVTGVKKF